MRTLRDDPARRTRALTVLVAAVPALVLAAVTVGPAPARAEPADPPTRQQVEHAQERARAAAADVRSIRAQLARAEATVEAAAIRAEQAAEAFNGARWQAEQAQVELRRARAEADRSVRLLDAQRDELAGLVAMSYQGSGGLGAVGAALSDAGPEAVMSGLLAYDGATSSLQGELDRFAASAALTQAFEDEAERAGAERTRLLRAARAARDSAGAAAAQAQSAASDVARHRDRLVATTARLQGVSVGLARRRQAALEERRREREQSAAAAAATALQPDQDRPPAVSAPDPAPAAAPEPDPAPVPAPEPAPGAAPPPGKGAARAIAFARAQLGEPYAWGAAGPGSWDCSGLVVGAWGAAGVSLPHYSAAQYDAATPISAADLRPGDLVFWGSTPAAIHHVAIYLGDAMIIHAPRTGRPVSVDSMYYWVPPDFFGRV